MLGPPLEVEITAGISCRVEKFPNCIIRHSPRSWTILRAEHDNPLDVKDLVTATMKQYLSSSDWTEG